MPLCHDNKAPKETRPAITMYCARNVNTRPNFMITNKRTNTNLRMNNIMYGYNNMYTRNTQSVIKWRSPRRGATHDNEDAVLIIIIIIIVLTRIIVR